VIDHLIAQENHHLNQVLAISTYADACREDPELGKAAVCRAFGLQGGLSGELNDELLLCAIRYLVTGKFAEGKQLLMEIGLSSPDKIDAVYAVAASVFKYFNAGMNIRQLAEFGIDLTLGLYQRYPERIEAQKALLDMLLYLGAANDVERILGQTGLEHMQQEAEELQAYRQRMAQYSDRCKLSVVLITYQRPEMLRHTLNCLVAALAESDYEIVIGVNDDWPQTRQVIQDFGISKVIYSEHNVSINLYKQVFNLAEGEYLIEIDDDLHVVPPGFDRQIMACLQLRPDLGLVGHSPCGFISARDGRRIAPPVSQHERCEVAGLPFGIGQVWGMCAGLRRKDFLMINGFSRATLSKHSGEEPQLIRKLAVYGHVSGVIFDQGLWGVVPD
jgi:hypothetical protein